MRISDWSSDVCSSDLGTNIVKLFVHTTQQEQDERLAARLSTPWKRWKTGTEDYRNRARREDYLAAMDDMFRLTRSEEHTSELQSLMRISYAVFCLKKKKSHEPT